MASGIATTNGDAYTNVFCSSNGKEYYVGDDGQLVSFRVGLSTMVLTTS